MGREGENKAKIETFTCASFLKELGYFQELSSSSTKEYPDSEEKINRKNGHQKRFF